MGVVERVNGRRTARGAKQNRALVTASRECNTHPRQPLLCRWIVKKAVWQKLEADLGPFRMHDDFERFENNMER